MGCAPGHPDRGLNHDQRDSAGGQRQLPVDPAWHLCAATGFRHTSCSRAPRSMSSRGPAVGPGPARPVSRLLRGALPALAALRFRWRRCVLLLDPLPAIHPPALGLRISPSDRWFSNRPAPCGAMTYFYSENARRRNGFFKVFFANVVSLLTLVLSSHTGNTRAPSTGPQMGQGQRLGVPALVTDNHEAASIVGDDVEVRRVTAGAGRLRVLDEHDASFLREDVHASCTRSSPDVVGKQPHSPALICPEARHRVMAG
jgi:hypothetical protein